MKRFAKVIFTLGLFLILIGVALLRKESIITLFNTHFSSNNAKVSITDVNDYYRDYTHL